MTLEHRAVIEMEERATRRPLAPWDRLKVLLLLVGAWLVLVWKAMADDPNLPFLDSAHIQARSAWWLLVLCGAEAVRQVHYLISEHSADYHHFWSERVFAAINGRTGRMNDWNRYRAGRAAKAVLVLVIAGVLLGRLYDVSPIQGLFKLPTAIWDAMPFIVQMVVLIFVIVMQFVAIFWFLSKGGIETYMPEEVKTRYTDVWGQDAVLERVKENMVFLEAPESIEEKGGFVPGGILLWGPPGTGKTLMAEAVAGETGKPFVFVEPGAFVNMFMGVGILKVRSLFKKLRKLAVRYGGVIVFFDEADALGRRGSLGQGGWAPGGAGAIAHSGFESTPPCNGLAYLAPTTTSLLLRSELSTVGEPRRGARDGIVAGFGMGSGDVGALQALLAELSGLRKPRGFFNRVVRRALGMRPKPPPKYRILVMMATNMPQSLDEALLRPGRIDRIYRVGYPSKDGRKRTYEGYLGKVSHDLTDEEIDKLATMTPYATGASIKDMVNEALICAIRDERETITWADIVKARLLKSLGPPEDVEYIERERHAVAVHESCHAVVAYRVRRHLTIDIATIEKGQNYLGMVASIPPEEQFTQWRTEYEADLMVSLASLAGERMFFDGDNSSGVSGDLHSATKIAMFMEGFWGMGAAIGSHGVVKGEGAGTPVLDFNLLETHLGDRVEVQLEGLYERTWRLLERNRREVLAVAHALETHKTLTGEDVAAVIEGAEGPLIDGRPYAERKFLSLAEAYHAKAVDAHQEHARVDAPLPVWSAGRNGRNGRNGRTANGNINGSGWSPNGRASGPRSRRARQQGQ